MRRVLSRAVNRAILIWIVLASAPITEYVVSMLVSDGQYYDLAPW